MVRGVGGSCRHGTDSPPLPKAFFWMLSSSSWETRYQQGILCLATRYCSHVVQQVNTLQLTRHVRQLLHCTKCLSVRFYQIIGWYAVDNTLKITFQQLGIARHFSLYEDISNIKKNSCFNAWRQKAGQREQFQILP